MQFTKLFNSILDSTIWQESAETKIVWITMLAMCDRYGDVFASIPGLASRSGVTVTQCESAIECFLSPDKYSRTKDHEGRRIKVIDGGWNLLNHGKYRELLSAEERREYNRRKQAEYRAGKKHHVNDMSNNVSECHPLSAMSTHTEAEAEVDTEKEYRTAKPSKRVSFSKPSIQDVAEYGMTLNPPFTKAQTFIDHYESNGWKVGKNPMKDWKAAVRTWQQKAKEFQSPTTRPLFDQPTYQKNGTSQYRPPFD